jgi:hypothetical protein
VAASGAFCSGAEKKDFTRFVLEERSACNDTYAEAEKIFIECRNIGLSMLTFPGMNTLGYDGELTGEISYQGGNRNELDIVMDIRKIKWSDQRIGDLKMKGRYLSDTLGLIESDLSAVMNDTSLINMMVRSEKNTGQKSFRTDFSKIPLAVLEPMVSKYISGLQGDVSRELTYASTGNRPKLDGAIQINQTALKVIPLNAVFYVPHDGFKLENNQLHLY